MVLPPGWHTVWNTKGRFLGGIRGWYALLRRVVVFLLAGFLSVSMAVPCSEGAPVAPDVSGHWAAAAMQRWIGAKRVSGYPDGLFRPDHPVTRAEFMVMTNNAFGFRGGTAPRFSDVPDSAWFSGAVRTAVGAGYISGYPDGTMRPNSPINRQEAAAIIARILELVPGDAPVAAFADSAQIPSWSRGAVGAIVSAGVMGGYPDGRFRPAHGITRAEAITALDNAMSMVIPNASMAIPDPGDSGRPHHWHPNTWGAHDAEFRYLEEGVGGSRSVRVEVSNYRDGDAKWYFSPIRLPPGDYVFRNMYRSDVVSSVTLEITDRTGEKRYMFLPDAPASANWTPYEAAFVMPYDAETVTVFHRLAQNGYLQTAQYGFRADPEGSRVRIPSKKTPAPGDPGRPADWYTNTWGDHDAVFRYQQTGYAGSHSVRVEVSNHRDGDAKWWFAPIRLSPGDHLFRNVYRSDTTSKVTLVIYDAYSDLIGYVDLPDAPPQASWTRYQAEFTMPADGAYVTVFHRLDSDGYLESADYKLDPFTFEGFARGLVTLTFDDAWEKNLSFDPTAEVAFNILREYQYPVTQFFATTYLENPIVDDALELIRLLFPDGHEIASHSVTHADLTALSPDEVLWELQESRDYLLRHFGSGPVRDYFATPYGRYNPAVLDTIMSVYDAHRGVEAGWNARNNFDITRLKVQNVLDRTTAEEVREWARKAREDRTWLILLYHEVTDRPGPYDTTPQMFREHLEAIREVGIPVRTMSQALEEIGAQISLNP